jgi:hypothetical protein
VPRDKIADIAEVQRQIDDLTREIDQSRAELEMLQHIDDDAQRDAIVSGGYDDRAAAKMTRSDVDRMSKHVRDLDRTRAKLVRKRDKLIAKLAAD